jgi:hypothetical protein
MYGFVSAIIHTEGGTMRMPRCLPNGALVGYTLVRHLGFMLDELSSQGLELWQDEYCRWHWRWSGSALQAERGFWALGEAIVDAVVTRYPTTFDSQPLDEL